MGTYIKGMEPPKHCYDCDFNNGRTCFANEEKTFDITEEYAKRIKHPDCPLIEIKSPHGRLIDADKACGWIKQYGNDVVKGIYKGSIPFIWKHIKDEPTVIEAEVE